MRENDRQGSGATSNGIAHSNIHGSDGEQRNAADMLSQISFFTGMCLTFSLAIILITLVVADIVLSNYQFFILGLFTGGLIVASIFLLILRESWVHRQIYSLGMVAAFLTITVTVMLFIHLFWWRISFSVHNILALLD